MSSLVATKLCAACRELSAVKLPRFEMYVMRLFATLSVSRFGHPSRWEISVRQFCCTNRHRRDSMAAGTIGSPVDILVQCKANSGLDNSYLCSKGEASER